MAYLNAAIIVATQNQNRAEPRFDPIKAGMETFQDEPLRERWNALRAYRAGEWMLDPARQLYLDRVARTVVLVCTASEQGKPGEQMAIGPGLAVRGIAAVLAYERGQRVGILERLFLEGKGKRGDGSYSRKGPVAALSKQYKVLRDPFCVADATLPAVRTSITHAVEAALAKGADLEMTALARIAMERPVITQMSEERAVLEAAIIGKPLQLGPGR